ncbi:MAG: ABC transporter ATP-binding protein [Microthrixaceae bacterium]
MSRAVLEVAGVTKRFPGPDGVTALQGVDLVVAGRERVAVVGPNGAGKSTLLGVIAGVVAPDTGHVRRSARCSALLELGAGFHPDLTGLENLDQALALAGVPPSRRPRLRREALDLADIGEGVRLPLRHFSNGMVARLACALALVQEPDLLVIDEVLGVGDAAFQRAVLDRIDRLVADGSALVLVTHSLGLAAAVTTRTVWLERGRVLADGPTSEVLSRYEGAVRGWATPSSVAGPVLEDLRVHEDRIEPGDPLSLSAEIRCDTPSQPVVLRVEARPAVGDDTLWMRSTDESPETRRMNLVAASPPIHLPALPEGRHRLEVELSRVPITPTKVEFSLVLADDDLRLLDELAVDVDIGPVTLRPHYLLEARVERPVP